MSSSSEPPLTLASTSASSTSNAPSTTTSVPTAPSSSLLSPSSTEDHHASNQIYPPLTTHWSTPLSCTWTYNVDNQPQPGATGAVAWLDLEPISDASTLSCYPNGMFFEGRTGVFSPGTCPNGWTTVSLRVNTNEVKNKATTTAICCSSEYYLDNNHCKRSVPTVLAVPITYNDTAKTYDILSDSTTTLYSATIAVYTIRALFQEDDKEMLGLGDEDDISDEPRSNNSLSLSERIGIGVGVTVFVLLIGGALLFLLCRRRSKGKRRRKSRLSHELNPVRAMHQRGSGVEDGHEAYIANGMPHSSNRRSSHDAEPPPAYELATETNSLEDTESVESTTRDHEIQALRVQKAAIQRRIEELERVDSNQSQDQNRN